MPPCRSVLFPGLAAIALAGCTSSAPLPVGETTRTFIDAARPTPANGAAPAAPARTLKTEIWYPAATGSADAPTTDGALLRDHAPYPLVLFVHGSSGGRLQSTFLTAGLAAAGYVVAAADFPLTAGTTPGGASDAHVDDQLGDLSFLADRLAAAAADPGDALHGAIDPRAGYAVVGHSTGGTVALLAAYAPDLHDVRLRAAVALAPCACFFGDAFFGTRATPLLVMAGTDDGFVPPADNGARAYRLAAPTKLLVRLVGGRHLGFTDFDVDDDALHPTPTTQDDVLALALARYAGPGADCTPPPPGTDAKLPFDAQRAETVAWTRAFLDAELAGARARLAHLESSADPAVTVEHAP